MEKAHTVAQSRVWDYLARLMAIMGPQVALSCSYQILLGPEAQYSKITEHLSPKAIAE
jgi:hypothetical protein